MKCLHICNDLMGSKVHENLYQSLGKFNIEQTIYYPLRKHTAENVGNFKDDLNKIIITSKLLNNSYRLFFKKKINFLYQDLKSKLEVSGYDIVHATTLFSDGAVALKIWQEFKIPYIIAVRGTDINLFLNYRYDLHTLGEEIISNAKHLIFISNSLENNFNQNSFIRGLEKSILPNNKIIYNGLDPYWINNTVNRRRSTKPVSFLYIGKFNSNKNVVRLIKAFLKINNKHKNLQLNLVGSGGSQEKQVKKLSEKHKETINFYGPIYDSKELQKMYQANHIFAMTSIGETFGLVYVEALSQGLPILFTENQGIDGTFKEYVGERVNPKSINSIGEGMEKLIRNYSKYEIDKIDFSKFSWEGIAKTYLNLYKTILKENK